MNINTKYIIFIISLIFYNQVSTEFPAAISTALSKADRIISIIERAIFWVGYLGPKDQTLPKTLKKLNKISAQLEAIGINLNQKLDDLSLSIPYEIYNIIRMENDIKDMEKNMRDINNMYQIYFVHLNNESISNYTIQSFIKVATSIGDNGLMNKLENIYSLLIPGRIRSMEEGCLSMFLYILKIGKQCDNFHASHRWITELFALIKRVETRALVMVTTAYKMRSVLMNEDHLFDRDIVKYRFLQRMNGYLTLEKMALAKVKPTDVYRCDAQSPIKGETYIELEKFTQKFLVNLKKSLFYERCGSCEDIEKYANASLTSHWYKADLGDTSCHGQLIECKFWSNRYHFYWSPNIEMCEMPANSSRRYQWLKDVNNKVYGKLNDHCPGRIFHETPYFIPSQMNNELEASSVSNKYLCDYCLCICLEDGYNSSSVRSFNFKAQISDYKNNMVVIGVRLVKDDENIINIQIKEGKLMPKGKILSGSERWVPVKKSRQLLTMDSRTNHMYLNDVQIPSIVNSSLIIGVKFYKYNRYDEQKSAHDQAIGIMIYFSKFNFTSGAVGSKYHKLISYNTPESVLHLDDVDSPLNSPSNHPDLKESQWVKFQPSSDDLDIGQTVVPFLDAQPVYTDPGFPLRGIGLFYKGSPGYGGYIAPKILTLDLNGIVD